MGGGDGDDNKNKKDNNMLLSDTFQQIVDTVDIHSEESIRKACSDMINAGFNNISEETKRNPSDANVLASFKRINTIWNFTKKYADKNGRDFMKENGFREFILAKEEFKVIHDKI